MDALQLLIGLLDSWMRNVCTDNGLHSCIVEYARGRGGLTMEEITRGKGQRFQLLGISQDKIGWRRFMGHDLEGGVANSTVVRHH